MVDDHWILSIIKGKIASKVHSTSSVQHGKASLAL